MRLITFIVAMIAASASAGAHGFANTNDPNEGVPQMGRHSPAEPNISSTSYSAKKNMAAAMPRKRRVSSGAFCKSGGAVQGRRSPICRQTEMEKACSLAVSRPFDVRGARRRSTAELAEENSSRTRDRREPARRPQTAPFEQSFDLPWRMFETSACASTWPRICGMTHARKRFCAREVRTTKRRALSVPLGSRPRQPETDSPLALPPTMHVFHRNVLEPGPAALARKPIRKPHGWISLVLVAASRRARFRCIFSSIQDALRRPARCGARPNAPGFNATKIMLEPSSWLPPDTGFLLNCLSTCDPPHASRSAPRRCRVSRRRNSQAMVSQVLDRKSWIWA